MMGKQQPTGARSHTLDKSSRGRQLAHSIFRLTIGTVIAWFGDKAADSDVKPAANPIKDRPPFRFEAGHR
ncbi:hypothetical protein, partial [Rhizobium leucaenae]